MANLSLPDNQDELVGQVAAANPHCIVVLETGGPVTMPWVDNVSAILEAWYPGIRGGEAIASILFGDVNPSGKLPVTFPKSEADLPHLTIPGMPPESARIGGEIPEEMQPKAPFDINYTEGLKVGYKWFDAEGKEPLFPFGFGLSYTTYSYSGLQITRGERSEGELQRHEHGCARWGGDCTGLRVVAARRGRTVQAAGGLGESSSGCR